MFPKPAFGNTSGFGSFTSNTTSASPFGGFKPTTGTSAFGAPPAFGAGAATQPTTGGGLFGATNTSSGLFGGTTTSAAPAFGNTSSGFGFGASTSTGGLFNNTSGGGLFGGTQNTSAFGAKPAGFGFGSTSTAGTSGGGLFGSTATAGTGLFGQQTTTLGGGSLFSNTTGAFGQQPTASGTAHVKYNPVVGTDVVVKSGNSQNINIKHHCITCMKEYESKSLEELRLEDYTAGRKGAAAGGMFGGFQQQPETKPLFGGSTFGQPATTASTSVFGGGSLGTSGGFGQTNTFSFGNAAQTNTNTTGLFGATKPAFGATSTAGTGLFGTTTTQASTFGTTTPSFGFGANTQNQSTGLFGAKPVTTGFGTTPASTGFGNFGTGGGLFGSKPQQSTAPAFGTTTPAFGSLTGAFGTATSTAGTSLFGANSTFGKPTTNTNTFGFNAPASGLGAGLGTGLGANTFQTKPAGPAFGNLGGGTSLFQTPATNTFSTGLDSGLGGGIFGNTSTLGGTGLGLGGLGANTGLTVNNNLSGASVAGNVHEQILSLVARPYGDSPLFKDLLPDTSTNAEDVLKPTNPAAVKAVLDSNSAAYRVTSPAASRLKLQPVPTARPLDKKSLFDGLEESDATLEDKLTLKPSRKRLVLRPKAETNEVEHNSSYNNRSLEEHASRDTNGEQQSEKENYPRGSADVRDGEQAEHGDNTNYDSISGRFKRMSSLPWSGEKEKPSEDDSLPRINSSLDYDPSIRYKRIESRLQPTVAEKPIDGEPTPRLYPNLDKELNVQTSERRASWLTTKPLRKPVVSNPDAVESSVRELAVRPEILSHDKENVDLSSTEDEHVAPRDCPPHPTGVKLTRPGYYTIPSLDEMIKYMRADGTCVVPHLTIGRRNYGNVYYACEMDVAGLDIDALVHFLNKEVTIYPDDSDKPPVGEGLNRRAIVTLDRIWPRDKTEKKPITDPERLLTLDYEGKLRRVCDKHDTKFIEYRPQTGSWVFRVEHFSKYSLTDSDEEDDITPEVLRRQLVHQQLQKAAPIAPPKPSAVIPSPGLGGLGGLGHGMAVTGLSGLANMGAIPSSTMAEDSLYAMQQTSLNLLNGTGKAFEMDTTEDNAESQSLYQDNHRAFGVKSPTSELARLEHRQSHNVQLMKASLYADAEMEEDNMSVSTGDQLVPRVGGLLVAPSLPSLAPERRDDDVSGDVTLPVLHTEEVVMKPLIVRPRTVVLKYHRKVPPFKHTIAGRLDAAHIADMSVCRARHSRVGFGPSAIVFPTSYDSINHLPPSADLCELGRYVCGRADDDWSEPVVARIAIGQTDPASGVLDILTRHLECLLEFSTQSPAGDDGCPRLTVLASPKDRRAVLHLLLRNYQNVPKGHAHFGVSNAYCHEVFKLCDALWGADLDNDGIPGTDEASIVNRHRQLLRWMTESVSAATDLELTKSRREAEDENDGHSAQVWTLLLGGRVLEACKVARDNGDLNMATLIAQASGEPTFRSLLSRQLSLWRECGALDLMSHHRAAALQLLAGRSEHLRDADWMRALHATARYLCPQVPSLEQVVRTYESFFPQRGSEGADLSIVEEADDIGMKYPLPPYIGEYDVTVEANGKQRRVLDLRYELIKARAMNTRPKLQPAAYTPDPMDYGLCFLLGAWFGNPTVESVSGLAEQLEGYGAWHLAVQVLAYHPNDVARGHLIRGVLSRHAPAGPAPCPQLGLLRQLQVPQRWVLLAQAHRAKYMHMPMLEVEYLIGAEQYNAAHKVLLDELLPEAVLSDNLKSIAPLLEKLNEAAGRNEVSSWDSGGQALYDYIHVCDEIRGLVSSAESSSPTSRGNVASRLEALRPRVASACAALGRLEGSKAGVRAARAECGARLVQLALAAGLPPLQLARLLKQLRLPPDCTYHAHRKITTELAEQASESCIESASSSPLSSHHRATVQS